MPHPILETGHLTSRFGPRTNPVTKKKQHHNGVDLGAPKGTPIYAPFAGRITMVQAGHKLNGNALWLDVGADPFDVGEPFWLAYRMVFLHLDRFAPGLGDLGDLRAVRCDVDAGVVLGFVGMTGRATGPHLHLEVHATIITSDRDASRKVPWIPVDPTSFPGLEMLYAQLGHLPVAEGVL